MSELKQSLEAQTECAEAQVNRELGNLVDALQNAIDSGNLNSTILQGTIQTLTVINSDLVGVEQTKRIMDCL